MRLVARIAQSVEQGIENPRVLGSIPSPGTTTFKSRRLIFPRSKADVKKGRSSSHAGSAILYCLIVDLPESPELVPASSGHSYVYTISIYNFTCLCQ